MAQYANGAVYWLGQDGNVYLKAPGPNGWSVKNVGKPWNGTGSLKDGGADTTQMSFEAQRINDPVAPKQTNTPAPSNPNGAGSGSTGPIYPDKSADISALTQGLDSVDTQTNAGISKIDQALGEILGNYSTEADNAEKQYSGGSQQNQLNLQKNKETSLVNASQGRRGLFGQLASLGALNGTGIDLANRAVQTGANEDLSGAQDTYAGNQSGLDTSIADFRTANEERKKAATSAGENAKTSARNQGLKEKQQFYTSIANDYADEGDTANAKKYTDLAGSLYGDIANTGVPAALPSYSPLAFTAPTLSNYLVNGNTTVSATPTSGKSGLPGLIASNPFATDKKKAVTA